MDCRGISYVSHKYVSASIVTSELTTISPLIMIVTFCVGWFFGLLFSCAFFSFLSLNTETVTNRMINPLVVIVTVFAKDTELSNRKNVNVLKQDFENIVHMFCIPFGYDFAYSDIEMNKSKERAGTAKIVKATTSFNAKSVSYQTIWDCAQIDEFNEQVTALVKTNGYNYDGLIYFLSCSGINKSQMADSMAPAGSFNTSDILRLFSNYKFPTLRNKPKILIVDSPRGDEKESKLVRNSNYINAPTKDTTKRGRHISQSTSMSLFHHNDDDDTKHDPVQEFCYQSNYFFVIRSTVDGYISYNYDNEKNGSLMIYSICKAARDVNSLLKFDANDGSNNKTNINMKYFSSHVMIDQAAKYNSLKAVVLRAQHFATQSLIDKEKQFLQVFERAWALPGDVLFDIKNGATVKTTDKNKAKTILKEPLVSRSIPVRLCRAPLVVAICISNKKSIVNAEKNYKDIIYTFNFRRHYPIIYTTSDNQPKHLFKGVKSMEAVKDKFKTKWNDSDMRNLINYVKKTFENPNFSYESLFMIISSDLQAPKNSKEESILDSTGASIKLQTIFSQFNNQDFNKLRGNPKLFFIDCNRGKGDSWKMDNVEAKANLSEIKKDRFPLGKLTLSQAHAEHLKNLASKAEKQQFQTRNVSKNGNSMIVYSTATKTSKAPIAAVEKGSGSLFIRALTKTFANDSLFCNNNIDGMLDQIRLTQQQLLRQNNPESKQGQVIEVISTLTSDLYLVKHILCCIMNCISYSWVVRY